MPNAISVVIPLLNEEESIPELYAGLKQELETVAANRDEGFEIIFVDDGSTDRTFPLLKEIAGIDSRVSVIQFRRTYGKTAALAAGFELASGDVIITMDGDLQHDPAEIPRFIEKVDEGFDIVCGWREKRIDNLWMRRIPSRIANYFMRRLSRVDIDDFGGGYKAYRASVLREIPLYGGMQRFIPALASLEGATVCQLAIRNLPRRFGKSRYGIGRIVPVFFDLLRIHFLLNYLQQPLRFSGSFGLALLATGGVSGMGLLLAWARHHHVVQDHGPLLLVSAICLVAGLQLLMMGLIGEMLLWLHKRGQKRDYAIGSVIQPQHRHRSARLR